VSRGRFLTRRRISRSGRDLPDLPCRGDSARENRSIFSPHHIALNKSGFSGWGSRHSKSNDSNLEIVRSRSCLPAGTRGGLRLERQLVTGPSSVCQEIYGVSYRCPFIESIRLTGALPADTRDVQCRRPDCCWNINRYKRAMEIRANRAILCEHSGVAQ
jgi:hypothetical protein